MNWLLDARYWMLLPTVNWLFLWYVCASEVVKEFVIVAIIKGHLPDVMSGRWPFSSVYSIYEWVRGWLSLPHYPLNSLPV
ncbi:MAG: hypothetical protein ACUZ8H_12930 [Candidatus Anammoxibacter sp.]